MNLNRLFSEQSLKASAAWKRRQGLSWVGHHNPLLDTRHADSITYNNVLQWDIEEHDTSEVPVNSSKYQHLSVVASGGETKAALLEQHMAVLGEKLPNVANLSWQGLLTSKALCTLAQSSGLMHHGLDTLDLSRAIPVDATTLDALASTLGLRMCRTVHNLHLSAEWFMTNIQEQHNLLLRVLRATRRFPQLRNIYLYDAGHSLREDAINELATRSSLRNVFIYGSPEAEMLSLNALWRVSSKELTPHERAEEKARGDDGDDEEEERDYDDDTVLRGLGAHTAPPLVSSFVHHHTRFLDGTTMSLNPLVAHAI